MTEFEGEEASQEISPLQAAREKFGELTSGEFNSSSLTEALKETEIVGIRTGEMSVLELHAMLAGMAEQATQAAQGSGDEAATEQFKALQQEHQTIADSLRPPTTSKGRRRQPSSNVGASTGRAAG